MLQRMIETESPLAFEPVGFVLPALSVFAALQHANNREQSRLNGQCSTSNTSSTTTTITSRQSKSARANASKFNEKSEQQQKPASGHVRRSFLALGEQVQNVGAGAAARTLSQMVIHPLDTIKTRMQVTAQIPRLQEWQHAAAGASKILRSGTALSLKGSGSSIVAASRGISDLYLGLASAVITTLPAAAVFFATSEACKRMMEHHFKCDRKGMACHMVSSSTAAVASAFIRVPGDVLKHRIQAYMLPSNMAVSCGRVLRAHGLRGMYVGFGVTLMRDVPEIAIQFTVYDAMLRKIKGADEQQKQQGVVKAASHPLVLGAVAGATAAVATTPLDVIKTQLQCDGVSNATMAIQGVLAKKGPSGFVAGMGPRVMQATLMSAVFFAFYEQLKLQLSDTRHAQHQLASKEEMQQQKVMAQQHRRQQLMAPSASTCVPQLSESLLFNISLPLQSTMIVGSS